MSNILNSINFLFLISLAVTSWIILCYFKKIQETEEIHVDFNMERIIEEVGAVPATTANTCQPKYDMYLNVFCIFACIYGLAKITHFTENYVVRRLHSKFGFGSYGSGVGGTNSEPKTINEFREKLHNLMLQIVCLEKHNAALEQRLQQMQLTTFKQHFTEKGADAGTTLEQHLQQKQPLSSLQLQQQQQNIFISNRHFHMNRQVFLNEGNMKLNAGSWASGDGANDFTQIWNKYLELIKPVAPVRPTTMLNTKNTAPDTVSVPTIMSIHELKNIRALYERI